MSTLRENRFRIISILTDSTLIHHKDKIVLAVSGGMDSMFLLHMFIELQKMIDFDLIIGHINHNLQPDSIKFEKFVVEQGQKFGVTTEVKHLDIKSKLKSECTEDWARRNRYAALEIIRIENNYTKIATAHHANDQIETILQRLSEKSGIRGLRGIHASRGNIIRPLLSISKKEIELIVEYFNIEYITDISNDDLSIKRNYFRHKIIPPWEELYHNLGESFQFVSSSATETQQTINYLIEQLLDDIVTDDSENVNNSVYRIDVDKIAIHPLQVKLLLFKKIIQDDGWRKHQWDELSKIITSAKTGKIYKILNSEILKDRNEWIIRTKFKDTQKSINIELNMEYRLDNYIFNIFDVSISLFNANFNVEQIDKSKVVGKSLVLRRWQEGDAFQPLGMTGSKKVSDFLIDEKVNHFAKQKQLVLTCDDEVIWVCGRRISEKVKIDENTTEYLELSLRKNLG